MTTGGTAPSASPAPDAAAAVSGVPEQARTIHPDAAHGPETGPEPGPETGPRRRRPGRRLVLALVAVLVLVVGGLVVLQQRSGSVSVDSFGAKGDGTTDDAAAIQRALDSLEPGQTLRLTGGRTYRHDEVLTMRVRDTRLTGAATLMAGDEERSSLRIEADDVQVVGVTLTTPKTTRRWEADEQMKVLIAGHSGVQLRDVTIRGSAAAGVYVGSGASDFLLQDVTVQDTRADGIHITQGSHDGVVRRPVTSGTGDDGVAVVSYGKDGSPCARITIESPTVRGTTGGRGVSVVGGTDVTMTDVTVERSAAAGIYIASEGDPYFTAGTRGVSIRGGTVTGANQDASIDHGAVLIYDGSQTALVQDVSISDLSITGTREGASRQVGVISSRADAISGVELTDFTLDGGPATAFSLDQPDQGYELRGWKQESNPLPDRRG